ncbi:arginyltransferase [Magnetococcales bacterium HHB-1]
MTSSTEDLAQNEMSTAELLAEEIDPDDHKPGQRVQKKRDRALEQEMYLSSPHPCGYFSKRVASTLFVNPAIALHASQYEYLLSQGFRRSGSTAYRPYCSSCDACIAARVDVYDFSPSRSFRRVWNRNQDLSVVAHDAKFYPEHFELYKRYIKDRHDEGPMDTPTPESYLEFLGCRWGYSYFYSFYLAEELVMVAVVDALPSSLSAVYTFFDPQFEKRSLGTYAVLWQIEKVRQLKKRWLYLGYWIPNCRKMQYKSRFKPLEIFWNQGWTRFDPLLDVTL